MVPWLFNLFSVVKLKGVWSCADISTGLSVSPSSGMMMCIYLLCGGPKYMGESECVFITGVGWRRSFKPNVQNYNLMQH